MFDKFKFVWKRFTAKVDGNLAKDEGTDWNELDRARARLAQLRFKNGRSTSTSNLDLARVRERINGEGQGMVSGKDNVISVRSRDSQAIGKWFRNEDITDSGSFNTVELNKRIDEMRRSELEADPIELDSFPEMEDTFMAFSKPEEDLFDDEDKITLSGVHYQIDPLEELEEEYSLPGIPMFHDSSDAPEAEDLDLDNEVGQMTNQILSESQKMDFAPDSSNVQSSETQKNPTVEILAGLEARLAEAKRNEKFWVDSGS
mgnify:CR=1 FL=1